MREEVVTMVNEDRVPTEEAIDDMDDAAEEVAVDDEGTEEAEPESEKLVS